MEIKHTPDRKETQRERMARMENKIPPLFGSPFWRDTDFVHARARVLDCDGSKPELTLHAFLGF
jgi:hypothetical protein